VNVAASEIRDAGAPAGSAAVRWPAIIALFAIGGLYLALPERLTVGPRWLLLAVVGLLVIPATVAHRAGRSKLNTVLGTLVSAIVTLAMVWSLGMLIAGLPGKRESPTELLRAAVALWLSNILVFASWYWRLDAGGPHRREARRIHADGAFLFPQMSLPANMASSYKTWQPDFVDYLFLAFNTSTAFSPTDVPVLSRWAKVLMMIQSVISLGTIAILAARAINVL
jgi:Protein of unknown function (DUF1345)